MKTTIKILTVLFIFLIIPQKTEAQFLKKLAKHAQDKIEREAENRSERRVDKGIDKTFDEAEDGIDGKNKKKKGKSKKNKKTKAKNKGTDDTFDDNLDSSTEKNKDKEKKQPKLVWSKYDFVPGDTVIFEDGPSTDEENGEFPSRWDLYKGNVEIGEFDGKNVIMFLSRQS